MVKNHLKRNTATKKWVLLRKDNKFVLRSTPGKHALSESMPLGYFLKREGLANTTREAKKLLLLNNVFIDKKKIKEVKCPVGFMDVVSVGDKSYRCLFDDKGRINFIEIDSKESDKKVCKILGKNKIKGGKIQVNLSDGRNVLVEKDDFKVGDSLVIELPSQKIIKRLPFKENASIVLIGGKYASKNGFVQKILDHHIFFKDENNNEFSTLKDYAFIVGEKTPEIKIK